MTAPHHSRSASWQHTGLYQMYASLSEGAGNDIRNRWTPVNLRHPLSHHKQWGVRVFVHSASTTPSSFWHLWDSARGNPTIVDSWNRKAKFNCSSTSLSRPCSWSAAIHKHNPSFPTETVAIDWKVTEIPWSIPTHNTHGQLLTT